MMEMNLNCKQKLKYSYEIEVLQQHNQLIILYYQIAELNSSLSLDELEWIDQFAIRASLVNNYAVYFYNYASEAANNN